MALPKRAVHTVSFVDEYCDAYKNIFPEVRTFENFKFLHLGIVSEIHRKSLTGIAKVLGLKDSQRLNNFLKNSPWDVESLRTQRLKWIKRKLGNRSFVLVINEIGDKKKGHTTEYVAKQYIDRLAKTENAIVSVNAYGVLENTTFPLIFKVFKPRESVGLNEEYKTKPQLAIAIIKELKELGFNFELVVVDRNYNTNLELREFVDGASLKFLSVYPQNKFSRYSRYHKAMQSVNNAKEAVLSDIRSKSEPQYLRNSDGNTSVMLKEQTQITPTNSSNSSWHIKGERDEYKLSYGGEIYNFVNWVEYGFKQVKQELGWGDFRVTNYRAIEKWWEIIFSTYWMISLHSEVFKQDLKRQNQTNALDSTQIATICDLASESGWIHRLNNLQSIIQMQSW